MCIRDSLTESAGSPEEPADSPEEPVDSITGPEGGRTEPTPSLPGEQGPAPARPDGPGDALSPTPSGGG